MGETLLSQAEIDALLPRLTAEAQDEKDHSIPNAAPTAAPSGQLHISEQQLERILDIPLQLSVKLGEATKTIRDVLALTPGSIVEFERSASHPIDIVLNGKLIARGEVVIVEEHFGVRITQIIAPEERLKRMK